MAVSQSRHRPSMIASGPPSGPLWSMRASVAECRLTPCADRCAGTKLAPLLQLPAGIFELGVAPVSGQVRLAPLEVCGSEAATDKARTELLSSSSVDFWAFQTPGLFVWGQTLSLCASHYS